MEKERLYLISEVIGKGIDNKSNCIQMCLIAKLDFFFKAIMDIKIFFFFIVRVFCQSLLSNNTRGNKKGR